MSFLKYTHKHMEKCPYTYTFHIPDIYRYVPYYKYEHFLLQLH